jgi:hypothetical protein
MSRIAAQTAAGLALVVISFLIEAMSISPVISALGCRIGRFIRSPDQKLSPL